jgi:hypothetical protein
MVNFLDLLDARKQFLNTNKDHLNEVLFKSFSTEQESEANFYCTHFNTLSEGAEFGYKCYLNKTENSLLVYIYKN